MINDAQRLLDDILVSWFIWARCYRQVAGIGSSPMFRDAKTSKGWDSTADIVDGELEHCRCASVDFHIGEMEPTYRTALGINARNPVTGHNVWSSPRLPNDLESRAQLLGMARSALMVRLAGAGIV